MGQPLDGQAGAAPTLLATKLSHVRVGAGSRPAGLRWSEPLGLLDGSNEGGGDALQESARDAVATRHHP
jgi:hypothetical protein